ncbi:shikimate kinase [Sphingobium terrigena]|uniref:Shikimate kinase n=1 Tax=Sphingobium terrigena TaxID=2304063 RepID=A0A418YNF5_9SPHN|nr:shikimate kinase [Sphingobium terrigena]RJG52742.1 shikimate kinase [Sphingobium terrigena]
MAVETTPTLLFLYGPAAAGKLTIARIVADRTGLALFHNHLIVDAVAALFPFGSPEFVRLRERFWIEAMVSAIDAGQSLIFTFAPEPSVAPDFPQRLQAQVEAAGGKLCFIALTVAADVQDDRIADPGRAAFGKLRSLDLLRAIRADCDRCMAAMPVPSLTLDTGLMSPEQAAERIVALL